MYEKMSLKKHVENLSYVSHETFIGALYLSSEAIVY